MAESKDDLRQRLHVVASNVAGFAEIVAARKNDDLLAHFLGEEAIAIESIAWQLAAELESSNA